MRIVRFSFILSVYAAVQHPLKGGLLGRLQAQVPFGLGADPPFGVTAFCTGAGRLPGGWVLVTLGAVAARGNGDELGSTQIIGERLALGGGPAAGPGAPCFSKGNDVVDIEVGRIGKLDAIIVTVPASRRHRAVAAVRIGIALQDNLTGITSAALTTPVGELVPGVAGHGSLGFHRESVQLGLGRRFRRRDRRSGKRGRQEQGEGKDKGNDKQHGFLEHGEPPVCSYLYEHQHDAHTGLRCHYCHDRGGRERFTRGFL